MAPLIQDQAIAQLPGLPEGISDRTEAHGRQQDHERQFDLFTGGVLPPRVTAA